MRLNFHFFVRIILPLAFTVLFVFAQGAEGDDGKASFPELSIQNGVYFVDLSISPSYWTNSKDLQSIEWISGPSAFREGSIASIHLLDEGPRRGLIVQLRLKTETGHIIKSATLDHAELFVDIRKVTTKEKYDTIIFYGLELKADRKSDEVDDQ